MENDKGLTKIGIRVCITQETDDYSHKLFEVYNVQSFDENQYPKEFKVLFEKLKKLSIELVKGEKV